MQIKTIETLFLGFFFSILRQCVFLFQYICYPWKDDSHVSSSEKRDLCRRNKDCKAGQVCYRHADKRSINKGLCLDEVRRRDRQYV
jgi:hypothetical protein